MNMHMLALNKPDGRQLWLYSRNPLNQNIVALSPFADPLHANPHLRWHPLRGEWITYAGCRQGRTFMPPPEYNPLAVTINADNPTELPEGNGEMAVFDNRFPSLSLKARSAVSTRTHRASQARHGKM
jgi:UDPglucose--hexose-1-phosphate uridylyltransferase